MHRGLFAQHHSWDNMSSWLFRRNPVDDICKISVYNLFTKLLLSSVKKHQSWLEIWNCESNCQQSISIFWVIYATRWMHIGLSSNDELTALTRRWRKEVNHCQRGHVIKWVSSGVTTMELHVSVVSCALCYDLDLWFSFPFLHRSTSRGKDTTDQPLTGFELRPLLPAKVPH